MERAVARAGTGLLRMVEGTGTRADLLSMYQSLFGDASRLAGEIGRRLDAGRSCLLGCSALKESYRAVLRGERGQRVRFVHLCGSEALIAGRLRDRVHRYMPAGLLRSQFEALEPPLDAVSVDISGTPEEAAAAVVATLGLRA